MENFVKNMYKNSSGDEIANVNFLRRYGTYILQNTKKREPTSFNQLDDSKPSTAHSVLSLWICYSPPYIYAVGVARSLCRRLLASRQ